MVSRYCREELVILHNYLETFVQRKLINVVHLMRILSKYYKIILHSHSSYLPLASEFSTIIFITAITRIKTLMLLVQAIFIFFFVKLMRNGKLTRNYGLLYVNLEDVCFIAVYVGE